MKSKRIRSTNKAELNKNRRLVRRLWRELNAIINEHDSYQMDSYEEIAEWFHSFPIESLRESLDFELGHPSNKLSLSKLVRKGKLRKAFLKKQSELDIAIHRETEAKIGLLIDDVNKSLKE